MPRDSDTKSWSPHNTTELRKYLVDNICNKTKSSGSNSRRPLNYTDGVDMSAFVEVQGEIIGSGGFGDVYRGRWWNIPEELECRLPVIAIKVIRAVILQDPRERDVRMKKIEREVRVWHACAHKNVLPLIGFARLKGDSNLPALITFWMDNGNVRDYLQSNPEASKLTIIAEVTEGLAYLHEYGVVHGDIKALNVLVDLEGHAYLCDFGLSRMTEDNTLWNTSATHAGGSMRWMAPELLLASQSVVSAASDMYAFAMTCIASLLDLMKLLLLTPPIQEILSGQIPFVNLPNDAAVIVAVAMQNRRPERPSLPEITDRLWDLICRCWQTNPKERPSASGAWKGILELKRKADSPEDENANLEGDKAPSVDQGPPLPSNFTETFYMSGAPVKSMAYSPDGSRMVCAEGGSTLRVWNPTTGKLLLGPLKGHTHHVRSVAFVPDGVRFVSASADKTLRVWNALDGSCTLGPLTGHTDYVESVACSPDGFWFASCSITKNDDIMLWNLADGSVLARLKYQSRIGLHGLQALAISMNGSKLIARSAEAKILVFDVPSRSIKAEFQMGGLCWCLSPTSDVFAVGLWTGAINFVGFDGKPAAGLCPVPPNELHAKAICFSPDGRMVVSGHLHGAVIVWDTKSGKFIEMRDTTSKLRKRAHDTDVDAVAFAPDSKSFASASGRTIRTWEANW